MQCTRAADAYACVREIVVFARAPRELRDARQQVVEARIVTTEKEIWLLDYIIILDYIDYYRKINGLLRFLVSILNMLNEKLQIR